MKLINFRDIIGQDRVIFFLKTLVMKGRIGGTLLFTGITGVGKRTVALAFSAVCNCNSNLVTSLKTKKKINDVDFCGICSSCKMIKRNSHPDIFFINFKKGNIANVADMNSILNAVLIKPIRANYKIIIVSSEQKMSVEASNMLLKLLKDYYRRTMVILIFRSEFDLSSRIISRCQHIRFVPLTFKCINQMLPGNKFQSNSILGLSYGSIKKAKQLIDKNWFEKRMWIISTINSLFCTPNNDKVKKIRIALLFSQILSEKQDITDDFFIITKSWFRDILVYKLGSVNLLSVDMTKEIFVASKLLKYNIVLRQIIVVQKAQQDIKSKAKVRLILDTMFYKLIELSLNSN